MNHKGNDFQTVVTHSSPDVWRTVSQVVSKTCDGATAYNNTFACTKNAVYGRLKHGFRLD